MEKNEYEFAFQLISLAGDAKSLFVEAGRYARKFDFPAAEEKIQAGEKELLAVHELQTKKLQEECQGEKIPINIILVHAQDHLTMAIMAKEHAKDNIALYKLLKENGIQKKE